MEEEEDFPFPFPPYDIQKDFMINLYKCLDNGNLGIFESPTGTGKTMSIICGAVKWLLDDEERKRDDLLRRKSELEERIKEAEKESADDWFSCQTKNIVVNEEKRAVQDKLDAIERRVQRKLKLARIAREMESSEGKERIRRKKNGNEGKLLLEDDKESVDLLLQDFEGNSEEDEEEEGEEEVEEEGVKLFFCSRTHSQLTQFISEFKKSPYAEKISLVPLGSRQNYCINKAVKRLATTNLINERCLELQRSKKTTSKKEKDLKKSKTTRGCPYTPGNQSQLIANIVTKILDIEEIVETSEKIETCPYYASRKSLPDGQVVVLPYNTILHENTRTGSGISLKNSVIIIDEAHNILESIEGMHSTSITGRSLLHSSSQLSQYRKRFESLFSAKNLLSLEQLNFCLKKFLKVLGGTSKSLPTDKTQLKDAKIYKIEDFESTAEIDTVNIFDLIKFIKSSKLIQKLQGYLETCGEELKVHAISRSREEEPTGVSAYLSLLKKGATTEDNEKPPELSKITETPTKSPLQSITSFFESLKSSCSDGRIFVIPGSTIGQGTIKFLLMNPAAHFHDIVKDARSVVLAGGTMAPISEFRDQLFISAGAEPARIKTFSCDHVVPEENVITRIITTGPNRVPFDFNYHNRNNEQLLAELGRTLVNLTCVIPGGIVVFLPSYNYEEVVFKFFERTGVISKIEKRKRVFREPKSASLVNSVLRDYAEAIKGSGTGSRTGPGTGSDTGSRTGPGTGSVIGPGTGSSIGSGTGSRTGPGTGSVIGPGTGSRSGPGTGSDTGSTTGLGTGSGIGPGTGSSIGSGTGSKIGPGTGSNIGPGTGSSIGSGTGSRTGPGTGSGTGPRTGSGTDSRTGPGTGSGTGALLFSVVGGKLSEGLNFSDDLGRGVVVVGMPYPNIKAPELQEKMRYLEENVRRGAGAEYYENCCMKAVNQCIGRAVRHIADYATVILLDRRFAKKVEALPGWIQRTLRINETFNVTFREVADFFSKKKKE